MSVQQHMHEPTANQLNSFDVTIVGGGLAGLSAAATILQGSDAAVALVEGRGIGSNNPTPMTFEDIVERHELESAVTGSYRRFSFHSPLGNKSVHACPKPMLVALDYRGACQTLLDRARLAGSLTQIDAQAIALHRDENGGWRIALHGEHELSSRLVIDASGRALFATRTLGLQGPRMFSHCFGQVYSECRQADPEEACFLAPTDRFGDGGGWFYPLKDGRVSFGYATLATTPAFPAEMVRERYLRALQEFGPYAGYLAEAHLDHDEWGSIPVLPPRRLVHPGLMVIGDAAGLATIWSCMGTEPALESGRWAGQAAIDAYRRHDYSVGTLGSYQRMWNHTFGTFYRQGALIAPVMWRQTEVDWNRQIPACQELSADQMLARLRTNWPFSQWWRAAFVRVYDWAGRTRRGSMARLKKVFGR